MSAAVLVVLRDVDAPAGSRVTVKGALDHQCPFVHEPDHGQAVIRWTTTDRTIELHSLAAWLRSFAETEISHEALVRLVAEAIAETGVAGFPSRPPTSPPGWR